MEEREDDENKLGKCESEMSAIGSLERASGVRLLATYFMPVSCLTYSLEAPCHYETFFIV
jgi:hypothetical protein